MSEPHRLAPSLNSERLMLRLPSPSDAEAVADYYARNRDFHAPYSPIPPDYFYASGFWADQSKRIFEEFYADRSVRLCLWLREQPTRMIGAANFTQIVRGVAQFCFLGYHLDKAYQGQGYMYEALSRAIPYIFEELEIHRIHANYMPTNERSGQLLRRLGFHVEGYARDYLKINGSWQDHIMTALVTP